MNPILYIKNYFYSAKNISTVHQLTKDFGEFPPAPLNCINISSHFDLVKTRGIGNVYNQMIYLKRVLQAIESESDVGSDEFNEFNEFNIIKNELLEFKKTCETIGDNLKLKNNKRIFSSMIYFLFPKLLLNLIQQERKSNDVQGYFKALLKNECQITIKMGNIKNSGDIESVISHEHIHFRQYIKSDKCLKNIENMAEMVTIEDLNDKHLFYLFSNIEIEARLHEVILSYYRVRGELPMTIDGFIKLLAGSTHFGWLVIDSLTAKGIETKQDITEFTERGALFAKDLLIIIGVIKDWDLRYKFILEVLPVMYGNLLQHYGDEESSLAFTRQIERPNLYDELYS